MGYISRVKDGVGTHLVEPTLYAECKTAAATATKQTAAINNFSLVAGVQVAVKFTVTNTAAVSNLKLQIGTDTTTAKSIKYRGGNLPSTGILTANHIYNFVYDGTNWELVGDLDTDTDTHRPIQVNGTQILGNNTTVLNLKNGSNINITNSNGTVTIAATDTNQYHKSGSWNGLTYTATAVNSADELKFTIPTGTSSTTVAVGNHNHDTIYSAIHQTAWNWASDGTKPLSKYVTFDANITAENAEKAPDAGWYNGFVTSHGNYLASFILNKHRTNNWYIGWEQYPKDSSTVYTAPTWYLLAHSGNVSTGDSNGQVKIAGVNINVKGLGTAAYKAVGDFAAATHGNHVPATQTANNLTFLRNDNSWYKLTKNEINALINLLDTGSSPLTANDYVITQYVGGGTTTTTYHRRPASQVVNGTLVKAALGTDGSTTTQWLNKKGEWNTPTYSDVGAAAASHTHHSDNTLMHGYTRSQIGTSPNYDNPQYDSKKINGIYEIRVSSEVSGETGTRPATGFYPMLSLQTENVMMQFGGINSQGWFIRGKQAANVTLADVAWQKLITDANYKSYAWARPSSITADQIIISSGTAGETTLRGIYTLSAKGDSGWGMAANRTKIPDMGFIAYWNGAYSGASSNLSILGTVTTGTWKASTIGASYIDTAIARLDSPTFTGTPKAPTAANGTSTTQIATTEFVNNTLAYANAMTFKGTLGTGGTATALPATHNAGDTYRVITAGTWAGKYCEVGTLIICTTDGTAANDAHWTSVETNEDGAVIGTTPTSSTDNAIVRWDGSSGRIIQDSGITIDDNNTISRGGSSINWNQANSRALLRLTSVNGWSPILSLKAHQGWWNVGHYEHDGYYDHLLVTYLADVDVSGVTNAKNHMDYTVRLIPTVYDSNTSTVTERVFVTTAWASNSAAKGNSTTPVYVDASGVVQTCTAYGNASVNYANSAGSATTASLADKATAANLTTTTNALAYYTDGTGTFGNTGTYVKYLNHASTTIGNNTFYQDGLLIAGAGKGAAGDLKSGTAGVLSWGDAGPQIQFDSSGQKGSIIFTEYNTAGLDASWHFVTNQSNGANVTSTGFTAKKYMTVGQNIITTSYNFYVNGSSGMNGTLAISNNINFTATGKGVYLKDGASVQYAGIYDNGSNLWIGATSSTGNHHKGNTFISAGYSSDGITGNKYAVISVPTNTNGTITHATRIIATGANVGNSTKLIYADSNGYLTAGLPAFVQNSTIVTADTDWNDLMTPGCYKVQMSAWGDAATYHSPNEAQSGLYSFGLLFVIRGVENDGEKRTLQIYFPHRSDAAHPIYCRMANGSGPAWQTWHRLTRDALQLTGGTLTGALTLTSQSSAFNDKNILFSSGGRIGGNTSGDIGIYGKGAIYIKPNSNTAASADDGIVLDTDGLRPYKNNDYYLGTSTTKWHTVYSTTLDSSIIKLHQGTAANPSTSSNARIEFDYSGGQPVYLAYTPNDSVHVPAGLKIMGNGSTSGSNISSPAWLEVEGTVYAAAFSGNATTATTATYSTYPKIVSSNEIRFSVNTKPSTATDIHIGHAWSDGSKDAKITGYRFKDGNNNLTQIYASVLNGSITTYASTVDIAHNYILMTTTTPSSTSTGTAVTSNRLWVNAADQGKFELVLGNNTPTSTAGGQYGQLALYSASSAGTYLKAADGASWNTATLQAKTGTIALTSDIPTTMAWGNITSKPTKITLTGSVTGSVDLGNGELTLATTTNHNHDDAYAPIVTGGYLPLSGGTMTGTITLAATGIKTNNASGYTVDQYGNFKHQRALASDRWQLLSNGGAINFNYSWESGDLTIAGALTATNGFVGDVTGNATTLSHTLSTNTQYYISGTTLTATGTSAATFDSNLYTTTTPGELSALRYSLHYGSVEKTYITYNATDDSLDFVFV